MVETYGGRRRHHSEMEDGPKKVIFLDIDGVLNREDGGPTIEEQFVKRLAHIVKETEAEIILSSSWRGPYQCHVNPNSKYQSEHVSLLLEMFKKYNLSILDLTPNLSSGPYARPLEIRAWLEDQADLERFVIIDDDTFWAWNWMGDYFVCTTHLTANGRYVRGITDEDAEKAIVILNRPLIEYF